MIITFALIGIMFSTLDILVRPLFHSYNGCVIYFTLGSTFRKYKRITEGGLLVYCGFYSMILAFLAVQFAYRASVVASQSFSQYFDGWKYIIWLIYTVICGFAWAFATCLVYPDEHTDLYLRSEILSNYGVEIKNVAKYVVLAYNDEEERREIRWNSVACIASVTALLTFQYLVMLTSGFITYRRTQSTTTTPSHQENIQRQFFIALICQVVAPTVFFQFPAFFVLTAPFFDFKLSFHSSVVIYGFSAYPLVDTLIVLKVITEYKNAYKRWIKLVARELVEIMGGPSPRNPPTSTTSKDGNSSFTSWIRTRDCILLFICSGTEPLEQMVEDMDDVVYVREETVESRNKDVGGGGGQTLDVFFRLTTGRVATPTIIFQLPAFVVLTAPFLDFKFSFHSGIIIYGFSAYPLMDTLIVFKVITEYKSAYKKCIKAVARDFFETMGGDTPRNPKTSVTVTNTLDKI
ncbi:unnamed protein product [Caenorhabditis brenneri]